MKANINRVVSRLEDIYQCGKKEDGTYTRMAFSEEDVKGREGSGYVVKKDSAVLEDWFHSN